MQKGKLVMIRLPFFVDFYQNRWRNELEWMQKGKLVMVRLPFFVDFYQNKWKNRLCIFLKWVKVLKGNGCVASQQNITRKERGLEMDQKIAMLEALGCDIDGAMERFLDDEAFYLDCYQQVILDPCFDSLKDALEQHDLGQAFDCAHTLKGITANLGLTPLEQILIEIVKPLRNGSDEGVLELYQQMMGKRADFLQILE